VVTTLERFHPADPVKWNRCAVRHLGNIHLARLYQHQLDGARDPACAPTDGQAIDQPIGRIRKIPDRDMTPSNFRSIAQIDKLVGALLRSDQQVG
jgi:hypothetical protein